MDEENNAPPVKKFNAWKETFRRHSLAEHKELFSRGLDGGSGTNRVFPWLYLRVFAICLGVFALFTFILYMADMFISDEAIKVFGYPSVLAVGGTMINIPVLVFVYELYAKRDFSFIALCLVTVLCSAVTALLVNLGYCIIIPADPWLSTLWTACLEEFSKALPALIAIFLLGRRNPLFGFLIGASAGVGMAISEDLGYLFVASWDGGVDILVLLQVTVLRAITSISGHFIWTGLIGWAFVKFRRPLLNVKFWAICLASTALHYVFNFPLPSLSFITIAGSTGISLILMEVIVKRERKAIFNAENTADFTTELPAE